LGTVLFDINPENSTTRMGILSINAFSISPGTNNLEVGISLQLGDGFDSFLNNYFIGSDTGIVLTLPEIGSTSIPSTLAALEGMRIPSVLESVGFNFIQTIVLVHDVRNDRLSLRMELNNPFPITFSVTGIDLTLSLGESNAGSIATRSVNALDIQPSQTVLAVVDFSPAEGKSVNSTAEQFVQGGTQVFLLGMATVAWGSFAAEIKMDGAQIAVGYNSENDNLDA
jgi:hypothetical protein